MYELPIIHAWESAYAAPRGGAGARGTPANEQTKAESDQTGPCTTPTTPPGGGKPNSQFQKIPDMPEIADRNLARKTKICYNASNAGAGNGCGGWARYTHSQERRVAARRSASRFFSPERRSLEEAGWEGRAAGHGNSPFQSKIASKKPRGCTQSTRAELSSRKQRKPNTTLAENRKSCYTEGEPWCRETGCHRVGLVHFMRGQRVAARLSCHGFFIVIFLCRGLPESKKTAILEPPWRRITGCVGVT